MDVIVRSNNNPVNDMTAPVSWLDDKDEVSSALIKEMIWKWIDQQNIAEKYHPDTVITNRTVNIFNDNVMAYLRKCLDIHINSKHWTYFY